MKTHILPTKAVTFLLFMISTMVGLALLGLSGSVSSPDSATLRPIASSRSAPRTTVQMREAYKQLPLSFEANRGQADEAVDFRARGAGYTLALSLTEAVFVLASGTDEPSQAVLRMNLVGANAGAAVEGLDELEGKVNYFTGNDPARWRTNIPTFGRVRYSEVYPGIDVVYYGNQRRLEYDFVVGPGRDARAIALEFAGAERVEVETGTGDLLLRVGEKIIRQHKPVVYQELEGKRREIEGRYALRSGGRVGFEVGEYDPNAALIIDPVLEYSTYLGGSGGDSGLGIAVDSAGNAYVTGLAGSTDFPTANALQSSNGGDADVFVTKLNAAGSALVYSTYLGGSDLDVGQGIAVDSAGNAYVTGLTASPNFPTANALQGTAGGSDPFTYDAFVTKLNAAGNALVYSTYLGGSDSEEAIGIAVDSAGNAYVTGTTASTDFPIANALQSTPDGNFGQAFVTKLNPAGSALVYSTYLGGGRIDNGEGIAVDSAGNAYVTGNTISTDFPIANAFQSAKDPGNNFDVFITKLNAAGSALVYSTYLGGNDYDDGEGIAVDSAGNAFVTGRTSSNNFPTFNALQSARGGGDDDAFVTKLNAAGSALVYSTYHGGSGADVGFAIAVDSAGNGYVTGSTDSSCFPTTTGAFDTTCSDGTDVFISKISETAPPSTLTLCPSRLLNIATRLRVQSGENVLIGGFIITGTGSKNVIIRGIGPSLAQFFSGTLGDPALELFQGNTSLASNNDWKEAQAEIEATGLAPTHDKESAIVRTLAPGSYTAVLGGNGGSTGIGVVEVYDLDQNPFSKLANIASRGFVDTDNNVMIGGLIVGPAGGATTKVVVRAIGPSLSNFQIAGALQDPTLDLVNSNGVVLRANNDWKDTQQAEIESHNLEPSDIREAALVEILGPGNYTAVVRGAGNTTGVGLVEVYNVQ